ncbi:MAG: hypothetical protein AB1631_33675, partial [Acidobacteriota bacterium]
MTRFRNMLERLAIRLIVTALARFLDDYARWKCETHADELIEVRERGLVLIERCRACGRVKELRYREKV